MKHLLTTITSITTILISSCSPNAYATPDAEVWVQQCADTIPAAIELMQFRVNDIPPEVFATVHLLDESITDNQRFVLAFAGQYVYGTDIDINDIIEWGFAYPNVCIELIADNQLPLDVVQRREGI